MIMSGTKDPFSSYLAFGLTTMILYQALLNMAVVAGLVPATGVTLPFFSHGGSSILVMLVMCGLLLNVSRGAEKGEKAL
jgi:cell division protein FtsW